MHPSIDFDERYLRLARAQVNFLGGIILTDNRDETAGPNTTEGFAVIFSGLGPSKRRLAVAGEVITAATLYFDVLEAAAEVESTTLSVGLVGSVQAQYPVWIGVHHRDGLGVDAQVLRSEIGPIVIGNGLLNLRAPPAALRGDSNFDGRLNISDPVSILNYLFITGQAPACPNAADFNLDARLDISDPITILRTLFIGFPPPGGREPQEVPCE